MGNPYPELRSSYCNHALDHWLLNPLACLSMPHYTKRVISWILSKAYKHFRPNSTLSHKLLLVLLVLWKYHFLGSRGTFWNVIDLWFVFFKWNVVLIYRYHVEYSIPSKIRDTSIIFKQDEKLGWMTVPIMTCMIWIMVFRKIEIFSKILSYFSQKHKPL